jgi:hypothetical protein
LRNSMCLLVPVAGLRLNADFRHLRPMAHDWQHSTRIVPGNQVRLG